MIFFINQTGLNKQITELQHEIQRNEAATVAMSDKLNARLDAERHHLFEIESAKRNIEIKASFFHSIFINLFCFYFVMDCRVVFLAK